MHSLLCFFNEHFLLDQRLTLLVLMTPVVVVLHCGFSHKLGRHSVVNIFMEKLITNLALQHDTDLNANVEWCAGFWHGASSIAPRVGALRILRCFGPSPVAVRVDVASKTN